MNSGGRTEFTDSHYVAFGRLLVAFQQLEMLIEQFLFLLIRDRPFPLEPNDSLASLLIGEIAFSKKLDLLKEAIRSMPDAHFIKEDDQFADVILEALGEFRTSLKEALGLAAKVRTERNRLFHSKYFTHPIGASEGTVIRAKTRLSEGGVKLEWTELSADDINKVVGLAKSAIDGLQSASSFFVHLRTGNLTKQ